MSNPRPKHVILITTDHMRYDCIGAHGNAAMHTPNLDRLVGGGVSFGGAFAQSPICMPSRCSFMTGLYPQQTGVTENGQTLPGNFTPTAATAFKAAGFQTAQIGKLHFQPHEDHDLDPRARNDYGFDVLYLAEEPGSYEDAYVKWLRSEFPEYEQLFRVPRSSSPQRKKERDGRVLDAPWQASFSGWVATQACRYMGAWPRKAAGQFLHMGFYAPHPPLNPTTEMFAPYEGLDLPPRQRGENEWADKPEPLAEMLHMCDDWSDEQFDTYRRHFYAMVTGVDMAVGMLLEELTRLGVLDQTLIVFTSDHGDMCGDHNMILKGPSFYDQLMRMPLVMHWPDGLGGGQRSVDGLVEMVDVLPTILDLCNSTPPPAMIGRSYAEALRAGSQPETRDDVIATYEPDWMMLRTEAHKYIRYNSTGAEVLYDLGSDPGERVNAAADPGAAGALTDMRNRMLTRALDASRSRLPITYCF